MPVLLIVVGALILALAVVLFRMGRREGRRARVIRQVPTYDCAQLAEIADDAPGMRVEVTGQAEAFGPPLAGPVSGEPCVWWRTEQLERRLVARHAGGPEREEWRPLAAADSGATLAVRDGTGVVPVDPEGAEVDPGPRGAERYEPLEGDDQVVMPVRDGSVERVVGYLRKEWIIRPGTPLYVIGGARPGRAGRPAGIGPPREGAFVVSVRDEAELARRAAAHRVQLLAIAAVLVPVALLVLVVGAGLLAR